MRKGAIAFCLTMTLIASGLAVICALHGWMALTVLNAIGAAIWALNLGWEIA